MLIGFIETSAETDGPWETLASSQKRWSLRNDFSFRAVSTSRTTNSNNNFRKANKRNGRAASKNHKINQAKHTGWNVWQSISLYSSFFHKGCCRLFCSELRTTSTRYFLSYSKRNKVSYVFSAPKNRKKAAPSWSSDTLLFVVLIKDAKSRSHLPFRAFSSISSGGSQSLYIQLSHTYLKPRECKSAWGRVQIMRPYTAALSSLEPAVAPN